MGVAVATGVAVTVSKGVEMTVGAGVGVTRGTTVDPHATTLNAAIAVPMTVVRFTSASAHATEACRSSYMRADAPNISQRCLAGPAAC
jgi:hypothetical protein